MAIDPCADTCLPQIDQVQLGEIYDLLNSKIRADLQDDYDCKKINGATYADTWAKMMGPVINGTLGAMVSLQTKETAADRCVKAKQCEVMDEDILVKQQDIANKKASEDMTRRQIQGFDDNARQKLYEAQINAWSLMFSSGLVEDFPEHISDANATVLVQEIRDAINGTSTITLGPLTKELSATAPDATGLTIASWGSASNATIYTLYVDGPTGALAGYPKVVSGDGSESITLPIPGDNTQERYDLKLIVSGDNDTRVSKYTVTVYGPVV